MGPYIAIGPAIVRSGVSAQTDPLFVSEFMANNGSRLPLGPGDLLDADGDSSDWIELYNTSGQAVDIGGWFLSDDADSLTKYEIPAGTVIAPDGFIVFDEEQHFGNADAPGCHAPFGLSRNDETVLPAFRRRGCPDRLH